MLLTGLLFIRTYLKSNLRAHDGVATRFKMLIPPSAGLRFFTISRLALNPNLIFEIGSNKMISRKFHEIFGLTGDF